MRAATTGPVYGIEVRVGWLTSARDEQAVLLLRDAATALDPLGPCISVVVTPDSSDPRASYSGQIVDVATTFGIPVVLSALPLRGPKFAALGEEPWRADHEHRLLDLLRPYDVDVLMLSGYMLVAGPVLRSALPMLNLHPALPGGPVGTQDDVVAEHLATKPSKIGAMVHLVTAELDRGPNIQVAEVEVATLLPGGDVWSLPPRDQDRVLRSAIRSLEPQLVIAALRRADELGAEQLSRIASNG